jgi:Na+/H+-translocating membrane pyrophosphatase
VIITPLLVHTLFGVETLSGVLTGALAFGMQVAIFASSTGDAWDNAKKYIEDDTHGLPMYQLQIWGHFVIAHVIWVLPLWFT